MIFPTHFIVVAFRWRGARCVLAALVNGQVVGPRCVNSYDPQVVAKVKWKGATGRNTGFCFVDFCGAKIGSAHFHFRLRWSLTAVFSAFEPVRIQYVVWSVDPREKKDPQAHNTQITKWSPCKAATIQKGPPDRKIKMNDPSQQLSRNDATIQQPKCIERVPRSSRPTLRFEVQMPVCTTSVPIRYVPSWQELKWQPETCHSFSLGKWQPHATITTPTNNKQQRTNN